MLGLSAVVLMGVLLVPRTPIDLLAPLGAQVLGAVRSRGDEILACPVGIARTGGGNVFGPGRRVLPVVRRVRRVGLRRLLATRIAARERGKRFALPDQTRELGKRVVRFAAQARWFGRAPIRIRG